MTREEFLKKYRFELAGIVMDAAVERRTGAPLAMALAEYMRRIDRVLSEAHATLVTVNGKASNGVAARN